MPKDTYILISTTQESVFLEASKELKITGFNKKEFINEIYGKKLDKEQIELILSEPQTSNPLFLKALIEELRVFGDYKKLSERIRELLEVQTVDDLFEKIFARCEEDYGSFVKDVLSLMHVSRDGLSESEILELLGFSVSRKSLSTFLLAIDAYVIDINGYLKPAHLYIEKAIEDRYLKEENTKRQYRELIFSYYSQQHLKDTEKARRELPWQAYEMKDAEKLLNVLCDEKLLKTLLEVEDNPELAKYLTYLRDEGLLEASGVDFGAKHRA
ncbi:MAG: hypothetical protein RMJ32_04545 [Aquificaceae bacterium]|nr:hypothetical protein [Aquificaceae bacterium]